MSPQSDITGLLNAWSSGKEGALERLIERTYPELHGIAARYFRRERAEHTLQCTALINEAYVRLSQAQGKEWSGRAHFFGFAAKLMRSILVDHARARQTAKRGGGTAMQVEDTDAPTTQPEIDILDLNAALNELHELDPLQSRIVELRYFGGLTLEETADVTGLSVSTIKREWVIAKAWIRRRLLRAEPNHSHT